MRFVFVAFIILPIAEMAVLIKVGSAIGVLYTIGLVLLTAVIGAALLRAQGLATLLRANQRMQSGEIPAREVCEGFILAVGGALLLTPGFITDAVGFFCLLPASRHWLVGKMLKRAVVSGQAAFFGGGFGGSFGRGPGQRGPRGSDVIEGEFDYEHKGPSPQDDRRDRALDQNSRPEDKM